MNRKKNGFTTVELVIVIAVIAILATVLIPTFSGLVGKANDSKALQEAKNAHTEYMIENGGTAPEYMLYQSSDRFVALHKGVSEGVFDKKEDALRAMGLGVRFSKLKATGVSNLFVYTGASTTVSLPETKYNPTFGCDFIEEKPTTSLTKRANLNYAPFTYKDTTLFENKKITKIDVPVATVKAVDENQYFTLWVVKSANISQGSNLTSNDCREYKIFIPKEELTGTTVNEWITIDLSHLNIYVAYGETLAFMKKDDPVNINYDNADDYPFYYKLTSTIGLQNTESIYFGVYTEDNIDLGGKKLSILGDSISTFSGISNDAASTNNTIGNNKEFYPKFDIDKADETWWKQAADYANMEVLVNNSWSGSRVLKGPGFAYADRCIQLHDNTGMNDGTNPDVIAAYIGINDFIFGYTCGEFNTLADVYSNQTGYITPDTFAQAYAVMIHKMTVRYNDADIFVFTLPANGREINDTLLNAYNTEIRKIAEYFGCYLVDIAAIEGYNYLEYTDTAEHLHPNEAGMDLITDYFTRTLKAVYAN